VQTFQQRHKYRMKELVDKLQGHTHYLLGFFCELLERYAYLEPMLFQEEVAKSFNSAKKGRGFDVILYSLFFECIQDVAKISMDKDKKTPSIENIMEGLSCKCARNMLREQFTKAKLNNSEDADESVRELCKRIKNKNKTERHKIFDNTYKSLVNQWDIFKTNQQIRTFCTIRDKLTAHLELKKVNGSYNFIDISKLNLKWGDLGKALSELQPIVRDLNLIIKNESFDFEYTESSFKKNGRLFWGKDTTKEWRE